jgi:integrase
VRLEPAEGEQHGYLTARRKNGKNSKSRNVPLTARVVEVLERRHPAGRGLVFHRTDGQPLYQTWLNQQRAAIRTRLGETGADAFTIMKLMGHSTVTVSQRYVHPSPEAMESAVTRMEAYNRAGVRGVGTNLGTVTEVDFGKKLQVI